MTGCQPDNGHPEVVQKHSAPIATSSAGKGTTTGIPKLSKGRSLAGDSSTKSLSPGSSIPLHYRQKSGDSAATTGSSLENSIEISALQSGIQSFTLSDSGANHRTGSGYKASIEDWIKETNENAVVPDALHGATEGREGVSSPTFTDGSLSYSQVVRVVDYFSHKEILFDSMVHGINMYVCVCMYVILCIL